MGSGKVSSTEMEQLSIQDFSERIDETFRERFLLAAEIKNMGFFTQENSNVRDSPAAVLFPASKGSGLCSYALVMFLVESHNMVARSSLPPINPYLASVYHLSCSPTPLTPSPGQASPRRSTTSPAWRGRWWRDSS